MTVPNYIWVLLALAGLVAVGCAAAAAVKALEAKRLKDTAFIEPSTHALSSAGFAAAAEKHLAAEGERYTLEDSTARTRLHSVIGNHFTGAVQ